MIFLLFLRSSVMIRKFINLIAGIICFWISGATWGAGSGTILTVTWAVLGIANFVMIGVGDE